MEPPKHQLAIQGRSHRGNGRERRQRPIRLKDENLPALRGLIGGTAVSVGLPILDVLLNTNGTAFASGAPLPTRFGTYFWGLGLTDTPTGGTRWVPTKLGPGYEIMPELEPLAAV